MANTCTPFWYLLPRPTYDLLRRERPTLFDDPRLLWVEDRSLQLGPDSPVRLFFRTPADKREVQLEVIASTGHLHANLLNPTK